MSIIGRASIATTLLLASVARSADIRYNLDIVNGPINTVDGFSRSAVLVNGIFPGTMILANKTDTLHLTTNVKLKDPAMRRSTSIHWHGLFQYRTASEDGPSQVNQCPISPGHSYTYDIPLNGQAGTFWYHSHLSSQYADGLRGSLIVYDPDDPHKALYDEDNGNTVIQIGDWYHNPAPAIGNKYLHQTKNEPIPDTIHINGKGRYIGGPAIPWSRVNVVAGKRYRFRIINNSAYGAFLFSIDGHPMTIIEADGISVTPNTVDSLNIYIGQRYSVVVNANQPVNNYWIRGPISNMQHSSDNKNLDVKNIRAVLHYAGAPATDPTKEIAAKTVLQDHTIKPLYNKAAPGGSGPADRVIDLKFDRNEASDQLEWRINNIRYEPPNLPTLLNIMANGFTAENNFTTSEHTFVLERNKVIELRIHGSANGHLHPFHLHGHAFHVVQGMTGPTNYVDPPQRDVTPVGGSQVIIRFKTDNPGPWFLHCHIDWHLEAGLAVVFAEAPTDQEAPKGKPYSYGTSQIIKQEWLDLCPIYQALPPDQQ